MYHDVPAAHATVLRAQWPADVAARTSGEAEAIKLEAACALAVTSHAFRRLQEHDKYGLQCYLSDDNNVLLDASFRCLTDLT